MLYILGGIALGVLLFIFWPWKHPGEKRKDD